MKSLYPRPALAHALRCLALLALVCAPAFAYTTLPPGPGGGKPKDVEVKFGIEIAAGAARSHFSAGNNSGGPMTNIDYRDDFDGGAVLALFIPSLRLSLNGAYHFDVSFWAYGASASQTLNRTIVFKNVVFPTGNKVKATDTSYAVNVDFLYGILEDSRNGAVRIGAGLVILGASDSLKDQTAGSPSEDKSLTIILPELVAEGEVVLDDRWAHLFARAEIAGLDNGYSVGGIAGLKMHLSNNFELGFHLRAFTTGIMDKDSYNHYNDFIGAGVQFIFKL
ncbi:MAG TPA: hypothetical protein VL860_10415 [Planctomycetota bacterium]|nr:hypothetical protein [Planctomycetota bacterium]